MLIYIVLLILLVIFASIYTCCNKGSSKRAKMVFKLFIIAFILIQSFRDVSVGGDLFDSYQFTYQYFGRAELNYILKNNDHYEIGFILFNKFIFLISNGDLTFFLFSISLIFNISLAKLILKFSDNYLYSLFIFFSLGLFNVSMNNLRSTLALSLIFICIRLFFEKKYKKMIFYFLFSFLFHRTIIIFLLLFILSLIKDKRNIYRFLVWISVFFLFGFELFKIIVLRLFPVYNSYFESDYSGSGWKLLILEIIFLIAYVYVYRKNNLKNSKNDFFFLMYCIGVSLQLISLRISYFNRIVSYCNYSLLFLIPPIIDKINSKKINRMIIINFVFVIYCIYILFEDSSHTVPYNFIFYYV